MNKRQRKKKYKKSAKIVEAYINNSNICEVINKHYKELIVFGTTFIDVNDVIFSNYKQNNLKIKIK